MLYKSPTTFHVELEKITLTCLKCFFFPLFTALGLALGYLISWEISHSISQRSSGEREMVENYKKLVKGLSHE